MREMLKSKLHRATVTETREDYEGSLAIDEVLMEEVDVLPHELVHVWNISNGERFTTYAIPAERGSGIVCLNGAAAKKAKKGDLVIITAFAMVDDRDAKALKPRIIQVDTNNRMIKVS